MEIPDRAGSVSQVGNGFPCPVGIRPTFPVHQILQTFPFVARVCDALDFIFLFAVLRDVGGARGSHRLARKAFAIWFYARDVDNGVDAHGAGKVELDSVSPNQLRDGIGTQPSLRQLPRGARETEVVGGEPDLISDGICRGVRSMPICLREDVSVRFDQIVVGAGEAIRKFFCRRRFGNAGLCSHAGYVRTSELEGGELCG